MVKTIADVKVAAAKARALGREISNKELGIVVAQVRKYSSVTFIRAQSLCLLNRLGFLEEGRRQQQGGGTWQRGWKGAEGGRGRLTTCTMCAAKDFLAWATYS